MSKSLYLINPRHKDPIYFSAEAFEHFGYPAALGIADLATTTVAALAPDDWSVEICEEFLDEVDFDTDADFIGLTGKNAQLTRMLEIADAFRARGKTVIIGGPHASLVPDAMRGHCDVLLIGELEGVAEELFADLERGDWKSEYVAEKPSLLGSPVPRFDLYPNERALTGCVQTSRGCPFECEFCDVIVYLGRKQRHKCTDQILAELDSLYDLGYRVAFLADDNFTAYRKRTKELLVALRDWNAERPDGPMAFQTQVSIDAARDKDVMRLCGEAGLSRVFIGIETPNEESLRETKKRQNVGVDLIAEIQVFLDHGISVYGGMMCGFDHDGPDIFERQLEFAMSSPVAIWSLGALFAPEATPLYNRLKAVGRVTDPSGDSDTQGVWRTNIKPALMSQEELFRGLKWLGNQLYKPENFGQRVVQSIRQTGPQLGPFRAGYTPHQARPIEREAFGVVRKLIRSGPAEKRMWAMISKALEEKPEAGPMAMLDLFTYAQVRCLFDYKGYWDPELADREIAVALGS